MRRDDGGPRASGRGRLVAGSLLTLIVVAAAAATIATWNGAVWAFEVAVGLGIVVGLTVAFGALDRGGLGRHRARRRGDPVVAAAAASWLDRATSSQLDGLDPVEHRRLRVGAPWPVVVVGPTGVSVVAVDDGGSGRNVARLTEVLDVVTEVTRRPPSDRRVDVSGLLVVAPGSVVSTPANVRAIVPSQLGPAIAHGDLVPMATVTVLFSRISGVLAPDLRLDAS